MSLAGIPPLLGFWGKFQVFAGAVTMSARAFLVTTDPVMGWAYALLATAGIVGLVVSLAYYGSVLQSLYADAPERDAGEAGLAAQGASQTVPAATEAEPAADARSTARVVALMAFVVVVFGLIPLFAGTSALLVPFIVR